MHLLYGPGQMPIRTTFSRFDTSFNLFPQKGKIEVLLYIYIYICLVLVRLNIMEMQTAVCVWYYSIGRILCLSTVWSKKAKACFTVFVLIRLPSFIPRWLNAEWSDFNKTEAANNVNNSSTFIIRKNTVRVILKTVCMKMSMNWAKPVFIFISLIFLFNYRTVQY